MYDCTSCWLLHELVFVFFCDKLVNSHDFALSIFSCQRSVTLKLAGVVQTTVCWVHHEPHSRTVAGASHTKQCSLQYNVMWQYNNLWLVVRALSSWSKWGRTSLLKFWSSPKFECTFRDDFAAQIASVKNPSPKTPDRNLVIYFSLFSFTLTRLRIQTLLLHGCHHVAFM